LEMHHVNAALLIAIVSVAILYFILTGAWPSQYLNTPSFANPLDIFDLSIIPIKDLLTAGLSFVLILIFDVSGILFGIGQMTGLLVKKRGTTSVKGGKAALMAVSVGTIIAALTGGSPVIIHAESVAGIAVGGRTGLTALVVAFFFGLSIFFGPLFGSIPDIAAAPSLILVGISMMKQVQQIKWADENGSIIMVIAMPSFLTIIMMPFTYSIANGIFFGLSSFLVLTFFGGSWYGKLPCFGKKKGFKKPRDSIRKIERKIERIRIQSDTHNPVIHDIVMKSDNDIQDKDEDTRLKTSTSSNMSENFTQNTEQNQTTHIHTDNATTNFHAQKDGAHVGQHLLNDSSYETDAQV